VGAAEIPQPLTILLGGQRGWLSERGGNRPSWNFILIRPIHRVGLGGCFFLGGEYSRVLSLIDGERCPCGFRPEVGTSQKLNRCCGAWTERPIMDRVRSRDELGAVGVFPASFIRKKAEGLARAFFVGNSPVFKNRSHRLALISKRR